MRIYMLLALVLLVLAFPIGAEPSSEDKGIKYSGHNLSFDYPAEWNITENPSGVTVGENRVFALDISMHKEGCYPLSQQLQLLKVLVLMQSKAVDGTPDGSPITQSSENEIGPYSKTVQNYKNPTQSLTCEIQGYTQKNATVIFTETLWMPQNSTMAEIAAKMDRLKKSLTVTLPDKASVLSVQA